MIHCYNERLFVVMGDMKDEKEAEELPSTFISYYK